MDVTAVEVPCPNCGKVLVIEGEDRFCTCGELVSKTAIQRFWRAR